MNPFKWLIGLFTGKKTVPYNILIVRSETQPQHKFEKNETSIITSKKKYKYPNDIIEDECQFQLLDEAFLEDIPETDIAGKGDIWFVKATFSSKKHPLGEWYTYVAGGTNKWRKEENKKLVQAILASIVEPEEQPVEDEEPEKIEEPMVEADVDSFNIDENPAPEVVEDKPAEDVAEEPKADAEEPKADAEEPKEETNAGGQQEAKDEVTAEAESKAEEKGDVKAEAEAEAEVEEAKTVNVAAEETKQDNNAELKYNELLKQLYQLMSIKQKGKFDAEKALEELRDKLGKLKSKSAEITDLQGKNKNLKSDLDKEKENNKTLEKINKDLEADLDEQEKELSKLEAENKTLAGEKAQLETANQQLEDNTKQLQIEIDELRKTDAGQLRADLDKANASLDETKKQLDTANADIATKVDEINSQKAAIEKLTGERDASRNDAKAKQIELKNLEKDHNQAKELIKEQNDKIQNLTNDNAILKGQLDDTKKELDNTKVDLSGARHNITSLQAEVGARNLEIEMLKGENAISAAANKQLSDTISGDTGAQAAIYGEAVAALSAAVAGEFLGECDPDAETDTVESMCAKIRRGVKNVADAIAEVSSKKVGSAKEMHQLMDDVIASNIESHAFTEIARWWAYSRLPFIANRDRYEGRTIDIKAINAAYAALTRLIALAGYSYQMPALFVENLSEGSYEDVTGREQLNLEYQLPNARAHADKIDRDDRSATILDIAALGYYLNGTLQKQTKIIH